MAKLTKDQAVGGVVSTAASTAGNAHVAAHARPVVPAVDDEIMALRLQPDGEIDRGRQKIVVRRGAQRLAQVGRILVPEAGMQGSAAGDPHAVAGLAEVM